MDKVKQALALMLRSRGYTLDEIVAQIGSPRSTVYGWIRGIKLPESHRRPDVSHGTREKISKSMSRWIKNNKAINSAAIKKAEEASNKAFTKSELKILGALEIAFGKLNKELIGGYWCDFSNSRFIIELTLDYGKGITDAIKRFESRRHDKRTKILLCGDYGFGSKRRQRARDAGVRVLSIKDFRV